MLEFAFMIPGVFLMSPLRCWRVGFDVGKLPEGGHSAYFSLSAIGIAESYFIIGYSFL